MKSIKWLNTEGVGPLLCLINGQPYGKLDPGMIYVLMKMINCL